jgi:hypothetical protein
MKKQKKKEKGFDLYSTQINLTYARYALSNDALKEYLEKIINKKTESTKYYLSNYIIANELHADGYPYKHVYLKLDKKI